MRIRATGTVLMVGVVFSFVCVGSGCGPYVRAPERYSEFSSRLQVDLPTGWLQYTKAKDGYVITRDGLRLEHVSIKTTRLDKKIEGIERVYDASMMPHEVADLSVGLAKIQPGVRDFDVEGIDVAQLAGQDGYRIDAVYVDSDGLHKRMRMYGAILGKYVCELAFDAADPVYFRKYESTFQDIVSSVTVRQ